MDAGIPPTGPTTIWEDNRGVIDALKSDVTSSKLRHVDIRINWLRDQVKAGHVQFRWIAPKEHIADIMTKSTVKDVHEYLTSKFRKWTILCTIELPTSIR